MRHLRVADVMTRTVVTVEASTAVRDVVRILAEHRIGGVPVVGGDGRVLGMITEADLLGRQVCTGGAVPVRPRWPVRPGAVGPAAADVMSAPAITVGPGTRLAAAAAVLARDGVKLVPVVDEAGELCGIVGRRDLLSAYLRPDAELAAEIRDDLLTAVLGLTPAEVAVEVAGGVVTLRGELETREVAEVITALIESIDGVVAVRDEITVPDTGTPQPSYAEALSDTRR